MRLGWIAALAALLFATPAAADITARYRQGNGEGEMVVQVNDRGESRMSVTEATYVTRDGVTYMLLTDARGSFVVRLADFLALMDELLRARSDAAPPANSGGVTISEAGSEILAGQNGRLYRIVNTRIASDVFEVVIGTDAELAPLSSAMAGALLPMFETMGRGAPGLAEALRDLLGRGAVLRLGPLFQLERIERAPVPASAFELPSAPISREALAKRLQAGIPR
jgi:hypothetical protein